MHRGVVCRPFHPRVSPPSPLHLFFRAHPPHPFPSSGLIIRPHPHVMSPNGCRMHPQLGSPRGHDWGGGPRFGGLWPVCFGFANAKLPPVFLTCHLSGQGVPAQGERRRTHAHNSLTHSH